MLTETHQQQISTLGAVKKTHQLVHYPAHCWGAHAVNEDPGLHAGCLGCPHSQALHHLPCSLPGARLLALFLPVVFKHCSFLSCVQDDGGGEPQSPHLPCPIFHALCIVGGARYPVSPGLLLAVVSQAKHALLVKLVWRGHGLGPGLHARLLKYQSQPPQHGKQWPDRKYHFSFLGR